jgi:hypothetical protein
MNRYFFLTLDPELEDPREAVPREEDPLREAPDRETVPLLRPEDRDPVLIPLERPEDERADRELMPLDPTEVREGFCRLFLLITGFPVRVSQVTP